MSNFPAVLIGGPSHSGKSVLVYSLTRALRAARVPHYVLRACPDGEGDWANEADQAVVQTIRSKGPFSPAFMDNVAGYLQKRHLPLIVDVGGKPTPEQEAVFALCTHAVLLVGDRPDDVDAYDRDTAVWQAIAQRQHLPTIGRLKSVLHGQNHLAATTPTITGTIAGLERGKVVSGPAFDALVQKLTQLFAYTETELTALHLAHAPVELTLDLPALARTLGAADGYWKPEQLPALLDYLPVQTPLAIYGRAPNWIYTALTLHASPSQVWLFDARLGWITPPQLPILADEKMPVLSEAEVIVPIAQPGWQPALQERSDYVILDMNTQSQYLDRQFPEGLPLPRPRETKGLVLSGKIPNWLLVAAAQQLASGYEWLAIYQPPLNGAVMVAHADSALIGQVIPTEISLHKLGL
ncbi:MAG: hypothetical protein GY803_11305 [Chloroflexi bacterium]|nr:hypothetical protein [Chloroflexota bacterium]